MTLFGGQLWSDIKSIRVSVSGAPFPSSMLKALFKHYSKVTLVHDPTVRSMTFLATLIVIGLNNDHKPTGPAFRPPMDHTKPPKDEIYA